MLTPVMTGKQNKQIAIAGAGVAGLAAAIFLRRSNHHVVVYDQFETPEAVGSGLIIQPTGQAVLSALGLHAELLKRGARLDRLYGKVTQSGRVALDVRFGSAGEDIFGVGVHRAALFNMLFATAMDAGVEFEPSHKVTGVEQGTGGKLTLSFSNGVSSPPYDLMIDALGLRSPLIERKNAFLDYGALWANIPFKDDSSTLPNTLEQRYHLASKTAGVMPIGSLEDNNPLAAFFWSLKARDYDAWRDKGIRHWKEEVQRLWPELEQRLEAVQSPDDLVFARYAHHTTRRPVDGRLIHIGDSWHAASPQLGQGANMALLDAYALTKAMSENANLEAALETFLSLRRGHVQFYQLISRWFTPFYQSDGNVLPWLRDHLATPLSQLPPVQRLLGVVVSGLVGGPLKTLGLSVA